MGEIWAIALPILAIDILNPVLLAAVVFMVTTGRPLINAVALISGHAVACLAFGVFIVYGLAEFLGNLLAPLWERFLAPKPGDFVVSFLLGLVVLWIALRWRSAPPKPSETKPQPKGMSVPAIFLFGAVVNFVGMPFAVPYFAFINQLMQVEDAPVVTVLVIYNILYSVPFLFVPLAIAVFGPTILPTLERINAFVERVAGYIMPVLLGLLGIALIADAVTFFSTGSGLI